MSKFAIGFDHRDRPRLFELWTEILDSEQWSEGAKLAAFEERWEKWNKLPSVGLSSWAGGALAALEFAGWFQSVAGYNQMNCTRPQTIGAALSDSPVGQLAYNELFENFGNGTSLVSPEQVLT